MKWVAWGLAGLVAVLVALGLGGWFLLDRVELGPMAARRATAALGRDVAIGSLRVTPGRWITVQVRDAALANMPGGTRPVMARLGSVQAEVAAWPLLRGTLELRHVVVDGADVLLERVEGRGPNWHLSPKPPQNDAAPAREGDFPGIAQLKASGTITLRTSSGTELPIGLDGVTFTSPGPDQPTRLAGPASYKGIPLRLQADLGSIAQYRDAATPFPTVIDMVSGDTHLRFEGTMIDPLNIDGARGQLLLEAATPETLFRIAGAEAGLRQRVKLSGALTHAGSDWEWSRLQGAVGPAAIYGGTLHLIEGIRETETGPLSPDRLGVAMQFETLDLDALLGRQASSGGGGGGGDDLSLKVEAAPSMLLAAKLRARSVTYGGVRVTDVEVDASQTPGRVALEALSLGYLGGKVAAAGQVQGGPDGSRVEAELRLTGIELQALKGLLEMGRLPVSGRVSGQASVRASGDSVAAALPGARASVVLTMAGGSVSRQVVQLGSTDIRSLFGGATGTVPIACVLGVVDMRGGVATVSPLRLRSAEGTIAAHGTVDLVRHRVDLTVASDSRTTGALALDVPVRVSGPFANVSVSPAAFSAAGRAQIRSGDEIGRLLPELQGAARASPCLVR